MTDDRMERPEAGADDAQARREWVKPRIQDMAAGAAELGGDTNVDGDPGFS